MGPEDERPEPAGAARGGEPRDAEGEAMMLRSKMRRLAENAVGLGAAPEVQADYLDLVGPDESDAMRAAMLTMSGCGLVVRGLWRRFGMKDARLEAPYQPGSVITNLLAMAQEAGGWTEGLDPDLDVGDVVYVSEPDHVGTIVRVDRTDSGVAVTTVDGGSQDGAGRQKIVTWDRTFSLDGTITGGPLVGNGRVVRGCMSLPRLAAQFGGAGVGGAELAGLGAVGLGAWLVWRALKRRRG